MKLYWCAQTRSFSALWLLEEVGAPYERVHVDIRAGEQDQAHYRAINPMGKVPTLVDGDSVVAEQGAICAFIAERFPSAGLAPDIGDPLRGPYFRWLFFAGNCIEPAYMQKFAGWQVEKSQAGWGSHELVAETLEQALQAGPWILGNRFSAADIMIGSGVYFGLAFSLLEERPAFVAYRDRCVARPAFTRASAIEAEYLKG